MICETYLKEHNYQQIEWELHRTLLQGLGALEESAIASYMQLPV